jgi:Ni/Co efflux regulator RcnB
MNMKYLVTTALALSLLAGGSAFAQDRDHDGRDGGREGGGRQHGQAPAAAPAPRNHAGPAPGQNFDRGRQGQGPGNFDRGRPGPSAFNGRPGSFLSSRNWHPDRRFRGPSYRYPRGFGYQRWAFGAFLPSIFLAPNYTLSDYWAYGLPAPPPGFHWIRVGPDALLVRYGDGYVLDAAYGLFY